jgi:hypothetical protein
MVETIQIELTISIESPTISSNMETDKPSTQDYYYKIDPNYRIIAANSILTTVTPDGQIKIDFLIESLAIPDRLTFETGDDPKRLAAPIDSEPKNRIQRHVQGGVLVTLNEAEIMAALLQQLVAQVRAAQASQQKL